MLNKEEIYKEDSINYKLKGIESIDRKLEKLLSQCENLKYVWDIRLSNISKLRLPFVFDKIDIQKFTNKYYEVMKELSILISSATYLYDYEDISNHKNFIMVLVKCLSKCRTLCNEYGEVLINIKDFSDAGSNIEHDSKKSDINKFMADIIKNLVKSSWTELEGLNELKIEGLDEVYTPIIGKFV